MSASVRTVLAMRQLELTDPRWRHWRVEVPTSRRERTRGLRGRGWLPPDHAMLFERCRSIHTFGMRFPIAVVLLDRRWRVLAVKPMAPRRLLLPRPRVRHILECPAETDLRPGDRLQVTGSSVAPGPPGYTLSAAPDGRYARD
jgi:uncharacterized protein